MAQGDPRPGEQYLHFKNKRYQIVAVALHSETMERYVVYQALYGDFKVYLRPYDMFISEVDHEKYPHVKQKYRFQYLEPGADTERRETANDTESRMRTEEESGKDTENRMRTEEESGNDTENRMRTDEESGKDTESRRLTEKLGMALEDQKRLEREPEADAEYQEKLAEPGETHLNPWLDKILDASTFDEKYKIVCDMQNEVTDRLIDDIAVVMDLAIPEGNLRERYAQLKYCLRTRQKYESGRLR